MVDLNLTKRQQEIVDFIKHHGAKYGYPPTVREIGKAVGLASSSTVHAHLANLEKYGVLKRNPAKPRAIAVELLDKARKAMSPEQPSPRRPGRRGAADPGRGEHRGVRRRSPTCAVATEGEYILRVSGESMRDAGILEGDFVVVHRQDTADNGDIVVALLGEEATVKRFFKEKDHIRLQPANAAMEPILSTDVRVLGRVVGVFRKV